MENSADIKKWLQQQARLLGLEAPNVNAEDISTYLNGPLRRLPKHAAAYCKRSEKLKEMQSAVSEYAEIQRECDAEVEAIMGLKEEKRQRLAELTSKVSSLVSQSLSQHRHAPGTGGASVQLTSDDLISDVYCCRQRSSAMRENSQGALAMNLLRHKLRRHLLPTLVGLLHNLRGDNAFLHPDSSNSNSSSTDGTCVSDRDGAGQGSQPALADPQHLEALQELLGLLSLDPVSPHPAQAPGVAAQGGDRRGEPGTGAGTEEGDISLKRHFMGQDELRRQVQAAAAAFREEFRQREHSTVQGVENSFSQGNQGPSSTHGVMATHGVGDRFTTVRGMKQALVNLLAALSEGDTRALAATPAVHGGVSQLNGASAAHVSSGGLQCTGAQAPGGGAGARGAAACEVRSRSLGSSAPCAVAGTDPLRCTGAQFVARCRDTEGIKQQCRVVENEVTAILEALKQEVEGAGVQGKENQGGNASRGGGAGQKGGPGRQAHGGRMQDAKASAAALAWREEAARTSQELEGRKGAFARVVQLGESMQGLSAAVEQAWCELDAVDNVNTLFQRRWEAMGRGLEALWGDSGTVPTDPDFLQMDAALGAVLSCQGQLSEEIECTLALEEGLAAPQPLGLNDAATDSHGLAAGAAEAERQRHAVYPATEGGGASLGDGEAMVSPLAWWQGVDVLASWPALPPLEGSPSAPATDASTLPPWSQYPPKTSIPASMQAAALEAAQHLRDIRSLCPGLMPGSYSPLHTLSEEDTRVKRWCEDFSGSLLQLTEGVAAQGEVDQRFQEEVVAAEHTLKGRQLAVRKAADCLASKTQEAPAMRKDFTDNMEKLMEDYKKHPAAFKLHWVRKDGKTAQETLATKLGRASSAPVLSANLYSTPVASHRR